MLKLNQKDKANEMESVMDRENLEKELQIGTRDRRHVNGYYSLQDLPHSITFFTGRVEFSFSSVS